MRVDKVSGNASPQSAAPQMMDTVSKNLRAQIAAAQKQMQELAANKDMEPEEKMERRKEIQQRITDLNAQLRQHEIELRQEKQQQVQRERQSDQARKQEAKQKAENTPGRPGANLSQGSMEAMISADRAVGKADVQGKVATEMKARANVLKSEIEHAGRGAAVEKKQESVAEIEARLEGLAKEQAQSLHEAGEKVEEAGKDACEEKKAAAEGQKEEGTKKSGEGKALDGADAKQTGGVGSEKEEKEERGEEDREREVQEENRMMQMPVYRKVDILL